MSLSAARAAWLYNAANIMLIISLVAGVVATALIVWMGNVKEQYANADADSLKERIAQADARAAEANRLAEGERLARIKIEAGLASRRLSPEQMSKFASTLRAKRGSLLGVIVTVLGDQEAHEFGLYIAKAVDAAGIPVRVDVTSIMVPPPYGLHVADTPSGTLKAALDAADVPAQYDRAPSSSPNILVGLKPPAF